MYILFKIWYYIFYTLRHLSYWIYIEVLFISKYTYDNIFMVYFCKNDLNSKLNTKLTHDFFETFVCPIHCKSLNYSRAIIILLIFFENGCFSQSSSYSYFIYKISIVISTSTTMNKQFQLLLVLNFHCY